MATAHPLPPDPVLEALRAPVVQTMAPERRALLEGDLRSMAARGLSESLLRECIQERLEQEADEGDALTPEALAVIERAADEAEADPSRGIPVERYFADRGIPYPPARAG
jgi:hypothetical protein